MDETVALIDNKIKNSQFTQHVVVNVAKLVNMRHDAQLRSSVEQCDIVNIDGMGVVWGARFLGHNVPERVSGIDLFYRLLGLATEKKYPVFLLGAENEIVESAVSVLQKNYKKLNICGFHHGYFWDNEQEIVNKIRESGAKLLFVAITSPKKENFINKWKDDLGVNFVMGVGGTFDVVAGKVNRAPRWMQNYGLEWFYRIIQEPGRLWKRYLKTNSEYFLLLLIEKIKVLRHKQT